MIQILPGSELIRRIYYMENNESMSFIDREIEEIEEVISLAENAGISELELEEEGKRIKIKRAVNQNSPPLEGLEKEPVSIEENNYEKIVAPLIGTFYRAPSPDSPPYVEIGDIINVGQTVGLLEAMKLFNEIKSEIAGRIVKILVEDTQLVKTGQVLFLVDTHFEKPTSG
ncbi:MAG: acetyl-CoA carboxylase [bacterium]|nr:acetyl-CoA carboxylase [bacterium]